MAVLEPILINELNEKKTVSPNDYLVAGSTDAEKLRIDTFWNALKNELGIEDSGWKNVIGTSVAGSAISTPTAGAAVRYRKKNGIVFISGNVKINKADGNTVLFTLPAGFRPGSMLYTVNTGTGNLMSRYFIATNGNVACEWVHKLTDGSDVTGTINWIGIDVSFPAAQ